MLFAHIIGRMMMLQNIRIIDGIERMAFLLENNINVRTILIIVNFMTK